MFLLVGVVVLLGVVALLLVANDAARREIGVVVVGGAPGSGDVARDRIRLERLADVALAQGAATQAARREEGCELGATTERSWCAHLRGEDHAAARCAFWSSSAKGCMPLARKVEQLVAVPHRFVPQRRDLILS
jgi:hypothetical protein